MTWPSPRGRWARVLLAGIVAYGVGGPARSEDFAAQRRDLVKEVESLARRIGDPGAERGDNPEVLAAMARVPRHRFVPEQYRRLAYLNRPLPIGHGQTISQPYIVALMSDLARPAPGRVALEIGTGSGYQAAMLAELGMRVYTVEIIRPLAEAAEARLAELGYADVTTRWGDGYDGWPEHAPFDAIVATAAASHIPPPLIAQLKRGGRMIIPVGPKFMTQQLVLVEKDAAGKVRTRQLLPVRFVPLTRAR